MRDEPNIIKEFVKIVQRYPEVYDSTADSYRMRGSQTRAWLRIRNSVKKELLEDCTPDELKLKWKGIRSSFSRYLSKLQNSQPCRKYYLYDTLSFLTPFVNPKSVPQMSQMEYIPENEASTDWTLADVVIKHNIIHKESPPSTTAQDVEDEEENKETSAVYDQESKIYSGMKRKHSTNEADEESDLSEDNSDLLQFFKSVIPDLKGFTPKEKRKFKMGVIGLIDVIEDQRQQQNY